MLDWIAAGLTLVGVELIRRKMWQGWVLHTFNSFLWIYLMAHAGYYGLIALEVVFLAMCLRAIVDWRE